MPLHINPNIPTRFKVLSHKVYKYYPELHDSDIRIIHGKISKSSMYARPVINFKSFISALTYKIKIGRHVRDNPTLKLLDLDNIILEGWLAHEFGHVVDYQGRSLWQMAYYGLRYIFDSEFARDVEHRADRIAVYHGFYNEIRATKEFLNTHEGIPRHYTEKIIQNYMSIEELELCNTEYRERILKIME